MAKIKGFYLTLLPIGILLAPVSAFWRLLCHGQVGVFRIDPLADYAMISDHAHAIHGANNFGFTTTADDLMASNCTSCSITQDHSAYWTPALYFQNYDNGTFTLVPQKGGMTVYYFNNQAAGENITAFPEGFSMISGDARKRNFTGAVPDPDKSFWGPNDTTQLALAEKAIGFNCLNYHPGFVTEGSLEYHYIRNKTFTDQECTDGLRLEVMFPSCWNGKDLTSENHKSHIQFPELVENGKCPDGFTTRVPVLFYETIFDIAQFRNYSGRFVLANGDFTGYGYHGDFVAGWNVTFLQQALDVCNSSTGLQEDCHLFNLQDDGNATACTISPPDPIQNDDTRGPRSNLPGNHPIYSGPGYAPPCEGTALQANAAMSSSSSDVMASSMMAPLSNSSAPMKMPPSTASLALMTLPPTSPPAAPGDLTDYSTTTYTSNGMEILMVVIMEEVTVTAEATLTETAAKRHLARHRHRHV